MIPANDNGEPIRFLSVCSGIEAASVAFGPLGWQAAAFSEIEKFPSAVLAHHYPDVPNLGDFTKIDTAKLGRVDILCGGTPCQAFSVAGLRGGLNDARGNLTLSFVRLAHELAAGNGLRNVIYENVPGILSDRTNAFGCFLAGLVGADTPIEPPTRGKWGGAGLVAGPKGRAAWRIQDAQYHGLAQRRRRVLVVADFGNGADPAQVLFELDGVQRHSAPSREAGKDIAPTISARTKGGGGLGTDFDLDGGVIEAEAPVAWSIMPQNSGKDYKARQVDVAQPLMAGGPVGGNQGGDYIQQPVAYAPEIARCDATREGSSQDYETTTMVVGVTGDIAHTLKAEGADASEDGTGRGTPIIAFSAKDYGGDASFNVSPTLRAGGHSGSHANAGVMPAIAYDLDLARDAVRLVNGELEATFTPRTVALRGREGGATAELGGEVATALRASSGGGDKPHVLAAVAFAQQAGGTQTTLGYKPDSGTTPTLGTTQTPGVHIGSAVRRLTPTECERLQGFPDGYTDIPWRGKPTSPDGPRYKALGNSWAVPKFVWLGRRIAMHMPAKEALLNAA